MATAVERVTSCPEKIVRTSADLPVGRERIALSGSSGVRVIVKSLLAETVFAAAVAARNRNDVGDIGGSVPCCGRGAAGLLDDPSTPPLKACTGTPQCPSLCSAACLPYHDRPLLAAHRRTIRRSTQVYLTEHALHVDGARASRSSLKLGVMWRLHEHGRRSGGAG